MFRPSLGCAEWYGRHMGRHAETTVCWWSPGSGMKGGLERRCMSTTSSRRGGRTGGGNSHHRVTRSRARRGQRQGGPRVRGQVHARAQGQGNDTSSRRPRARRRPRRVVGAGFAIALVLPQHTHEAHLSLRTIWLQTLLPTSDGFAPTRARTAFFAHDGPHGHVCSDPSVIPAHTTGEALRPAGMVATRKSAPP